MLDLFKSLGAVSGLLQNKDKLRGLAATIRSRLALVRVTGSAGGGAARAEVSGDLRVQRLELSPSLAASLAGDAASRDQAQALIVEAVNDGLRLAQAAARDVIAAETKDLGLDGLARELGGLL